MDNKNSYTYKKYLKHKSTIRTIEVAIGLFGLFLLSKLVLFKGSNLLIVIFLLAFAIKVIDVILVDERRHNYLTWGRGAGAELTVGRQLERLGPDYKIINDINSGRGNVDHVCIGPTGIFVIETKAHRGVVSYTNQILINGKNLEKDYLAQTQAEVRFVADFLHERLGGTYSVQGILEFPYAKIDASIRGPKENVWIGGRGFANYVIKKGHSNLKPAELAAISQVLQSLTTKSPKL